MKNKTKVHNNYENEELSEAIELQEDSGVESFVKKNKNLLIGAIVIVAIVAVAIVFFVKSSAQKAEEASLKLSRILPYVEQENYAKALEGDKATKIRGEAVIGLAQIVEDYSGTDAGKLAALYAGNCCLSLNRAKEAEKYFETAQNSNSFVVIQGANAGIGKVYEMEGKFSEAADYYKNAAEYAAEDEVKARYSLYAGLCYEKAKNKENAIEKFKEVVNLSPMSEFSDLAKEGLTRLGTIID
jgi:tetratricopeptide (TPR) repeat protein